MNRITDLKNILIKDSKNLREALADLDKNGIQILLLKNSNGKLSGVLTDGDIRRYILSNGPMDISIKKIASKNFIKSSEDNKNKLNSMLDKEDINHIPIVDKNGIVKYLITKNISEKIKTKVPVVIVAGGQGTRLSPLTKIIPKPLMPVGDVTMIEKIMENFHKQGLSNFKLIINYKKNLIKTYLNELDHPYHIEFIEEEKTGNTAGSLALLKEKIDGPFIVSNCDVIADLSYQSLLDWHNEKKAEMTILGVRKQVDIPYGVIKMDSKYAVKEIYEKPFYNNMIVSGIYVMNPSVLKLIPKSMILGMDKLMEKLIKKNMNLTCYPIESGWQDIGQFEEYKKLLEI